MTTSSLANASLCCAAFFGDLDAIRAHLDDGADINGTAMNNAGEALTPLMWASAGGRIEAMYFLLAHGASPTFTDPQTGVTALHCAAMANQPEAVAVLMVHGVDRCATADHNRGSELVKPIDLTRPGTAAHALLSR
ncbi:MULTISPECIES: ankyrin repeat domain-containing protein [Burkholderia]|uniref:ankyrin repeat domain-containing protein n=1 Tax=Burkholderia TaxID=32008 RepID=UPI001903CA53|nr:MULTISPECIES: ankyrin repeat domain-containing protein [Burkholderia]MBJ9920639.1 ankyrin repeat domain-containing protein [Burkholderia cenocepacia]UVS90899.1 ankyrin repeat domain-containing protein [Burkholderia glumae]